MAWDQLRLHMLSIFTGFSYQNCMAWTQQTIDETACSIYTLFDSLPKTGKPSKANEWTTVSAFALKSEDTLKIVSLATGTRCIGQELLDPDGGRLHDSHSEVLARRAFQRFITNNIEDVYAGKESEWFTLDSIDGKVHKKNDCSIVFLSSHTPCGDASIFDRPDGDVHPCKKMKLDNMEHKTGHETDSDIYRTGAKCVPGGRQDSHEHGVNYHVTGTLRIKPGRGNPTQSLSCSDKMARWNVLGCQGCLPMLFLHTPLYIDTIIIDGCPYDESATARALYNRLEGVTSFLDGNRGYHLNHPRLYYSNVCFRYSKQQVERRSNGKTAPCASSVVWYRTDGEKYSLESSVNGYKQGVTKKALGTQAARLSVSRYMMFKKFLDIWSRVPVEKRQLYLAGIEYPSTYREWKNITSYMEMWEKLKLTDFFKLWPCKDQLFSSFKV